MRHVDRAFVGLAVASALSAMCLGIWMSGADDYALVPLHAHLNLLGWVTFALFGLAYRTGIAKSDGWAVVHFWLSVAAVAIFSFGIAVAILLGRPKPVYVGAALIVASMLMFGLNVARAARRDAALAAEPSLSAPLQQRRGLKAGAAGE